jgi:ribonuclease HII
MIADWWAEERAAQAEGFVCVAGIDEAGRGALAGPVIAACVVLPCEPDLPGINDSKLLTPAQREELFVRIHRCARGIGIGRVECTVVDEINVLRATHEAMHLALANLPFGLNPDLALIDGLPVHPFPVPQTAIVGGDGLCGSIAAASIIAKVTRDRIMCEMDLLYPGYGFADHKGYGSPKHKRALAALGPCPQHRRTYRPVAASFESDLEFAPQPAKRQKRGKPSR